MTNDYIIDRADEILAEEEGKLQKPKNTNSNRRGSFCSNNIKNKYTAG